MSLVDGLSGVLPSLGLLQKQAKNAKIFLGHDDAGWTTLRRMLMDEVLPFDFRESRSGGNTPEELRMGRIKFKAVDFVGHAHARRVLLDYQPTVDAVVYLVDAFDHRRFAQSQNELRDLLAAESLSQVPFLVLANRGDIPSLEPEEEVEYRLALLAIYRLELYLGLTDLTTGKGNVDLTGTNIRPLEVFMYGAVDRMGYVEAFRWLCQYIK